MPEALWPLSALSAYLVVAAAALAVRVSLWGPFRDEETETRGASTLLPMSARMFFAWAIAPVWRLVRWTGIPATAVTTVAMLLAFAAGIAAAAGQLAPAGWLYLASGLCDVLDGRVARESGTASNRGAATDSVLDRYSDAAVFVGLAWLYRSQWPGLVAVLGLAGSLLVSYVRARGEGLGVGVKVGLMQRPERVVLVGASLALAPVIAHLSEGRVGAHAVVIGTITFVAVMSHVTAIHRFVVVLRKLDRRRGPSTRWRLLAPATITALVATLLDFALVTVLVGSNQVSAAAATAAGCALGGTANFLMNRRWTFGSTDRPTPQALRYGIVSLSSALLNSGGVAAVMWLPLGDYRIAWALVRCCVFVCWNFPLQRDYVYGERGAHLPGELPGASPQVTQEPMSAR